MNEQPCKYCCKYPTGLVCGTALSNGGASSVRVEIEDDLLVLINTSMNFAMNSTLIKFCPVCGRKLEWEDE